MIIRFLLISLALLFSTYTLAATYTLDSSLFSGQTFNSASAACAAFASRRGVGGEVAYNYNNFPIACKGQKTGEGPYDGPAYLVQIYETGEPNCYEDPPGPVVVVWFAKTEPTPKTKCEPLGAGYCQIDCSGSPKINYPSNANVTCHYTSKTPVSSCYPSWDGVCNPDDPYGGCYTPPNDGCTRQPNGSIVCPPDVPPPTPEPQCNYNSTNAYCEPTGGACPKGYVPGTYNGKTICVKNSHEEPDCPKDSYGNYNCAGDPNQPPTNPPNNQQGDGSCNGTGNCSPNSNNTTNNTYNNTTNNNTTNNITNNEAPEVDFSGVIAKLEEVKTGVAAVDSSVKALATAIKAVEDAVNASSEKITAAVKSGFTAISEKLGNIDKSINDGTKQAKDDAEKQLRVSLDQKIQDKEYQEWEKESRNCKLASNGTYTTNGQANTANARICEFADSFEDYKKWVKGEKEGTGIPETLPDGKLNVRDTSLADAGLTGTEMETDYVKFSAACPADVQIPIKIGSASSQLTLSLKPACDLAPFFRAGLIAIAYLSGAFIVLGIGRSSGAGDA